MPCGLRRCSGRARYARRLGTLDVRQAASVIEAIALGRRSQGDIARAMELSTATLVPHLKQLVALGYLGRAHRAPSPLSA